jgi:hypothetical protein
MLSFKSFIISVIEQTAVFTAIQESSAGVTRIASIEQILLIVGNLHYRSVVLCVEELCLAASHSHYHSSVVVAELSAEDKSVCVLNKK